MNALLVNLSLSNHNNSRELDPNSLFQSLQEMQYIPLLWIPSHCQIQGYKEERLGSRLQLSVAAIFRCRLRTAFHCRLKISDTSDCACKTGVQDLENIQQIRVARALEWTSVAIWGWLERKSIRIDSGPGHQEHRHSGLSRDQKTFKNAEKEVEKNIL